MLARVLLDANVLYSRTLRDWTLMLSLHGGMYRGYWTEDIAAERIYRLRRAHTDWDGAVLSSIRGKLEMCVSTRSRRTSVVMTIRALIPTMRICTRPPWRYVVTNDRGFADEAELDLFRTRSTPPTTSWSWWTTRHR